MQKLQIDRTRWRRGYSLVRMNNLYNSDDGCYCALGWLGKEKLGLDDRDMMDQSSLAHVLLNLSVVKTSDQMDVIQKFIQHLDLKKNYSPKCFRETWGSNDSHFIKDSDRERNLIKIFRVHFNLQLEFIK